MIRLIIVLAFLLNACSTPVSSNYKMVNLPHSPAAWQIYDSGAPSEIRVSSAILIFYRNWEVRFGDSERKVKEALNKVMIEWSSEEKIHRSIGTNLEGRIVTQAYIKGMTLSPSYVWVKTNMYNRIFATSLVHELVHVALWAEGCKSGDPDHEGDSILCWTKEHTEFIQDVNLYLAEVDL